MYIYTYKTDSVGGGVLVVGYIVYHVSCPRARPSSVPPPIFGTVMEEKIGLRIHGTGVGWVGVVGMAEGSAKNTRVVGRGQR